MREGARFRVLALLAMALLLAACNRPDLLIPTSAPSPESLSLEEIQTAVAKTLEAEATQTAAARPSETEPAPEPTEEPSDTPEPTSVEPAKELSCVVVSARLNLRSGPGVNYDPPLRTVTEGTILIPFARNEDGSWLEGRLLDDPSDYWFSAGVQFTECEDDPLNLPIGIIPPTPTPTNTPIATATYTPSPTDTPRPTDEPTKTPTPCPKFSIARFDANESLVEGSWVVNLTWATSGGCGPITGTISAKFSDQGSPYATYNLTGSSGKLSDTPKPRSDGTYEIIYTLVLKDYTGQTDSAEAKVSVYWIG